LRPVILLALLALLTAQLAVQLHVLGHARASTDSSGLPDRHTRLCVDCAVAVPLLAMVGGAPQLLAAVPHGPVSALPVAATAPEALEPRYAFRSRAPPV
jgi:hypothetical protein